MACIGTAFIGMTYMVMANIGMAYIGMAYIVMAYIVTQMPVRMPTLIGCTHVQANSRTGVRGCPSAAAWNILSPA